MGNSLRYLGGAVGFGFGAVWMTAGIGAAIACLLLAALGYGAVFVAERAQAGAITPREAVLSLPEDEFDLDHERYDEPADDATSPLAAEVEYGWPLGHGAVAKPTA